jgi:hypothetical protein
MYDAVKIQVNNKASYLMSIYPGPLTKTIRNSISKTYSLPEYESANTLLDSIIGDSNITVLASWFSLTLLEVLSKSNKIKNITMLDHDKSVIAIGHTIKQLYPNMNIEYVRKNVVFDDITEYTNNSNIIVVPSINMLLPFNDLLPNLPKDMLISVTGTSNMVMKYGNPIYNVDDLKSQIKYTDLLSAKQYDSMWGDNFKFITSSIVARI